MWEGCQIVADLCDNWEHFLKLYHIAYILLPFSTTMFKFFFIKSIIFMIGLIWKSSVYGARRHLMHERIFYKLEGKSLIGNLTEVRKVRDFFDCSIICMEKGVPACLSFNIGRVTDDNGYCQCELSNSERYMEPERMQARINFDYYGTTTEVSQFLFFLLERRWNRLKLFSSNFIFLFDINSKTFANSTRSANDLQLFSCFPNNAWVITLVNPTERKCGLLYGYFIYKSKYYLFKLSVKDHARKWIIFILFAKKKQGENTKMKKFIWVKLTAVTCPHFFLGKCTYI